MKDLVIKRVLRRSGKNGKGVYVIYFRYLLMWDRVRYPYFECSTRLSIKDAKLWDYNAQEMKGNSEAIRRLNQQLREKENDVLTHWKKYSVNNATLEFIRLKSNINGLMGGKDVGKYDFSSVKFIPDIFDLHIEAGKPGGGEYTKMRKNRYKYLKQMMINYCTFRYKTEKVPLEKLSKNFYNDFRRYLGQTLNLKQNTLQGYMKVFEATVKSEWERSEYATKYPFSGCKTENGKTSRTALSQDELNKIKVLSDVQLGKTVANARRIFLFATYTGISYCDLKALTSDYIQTIQNEDYLLKDREKNVNNPNSNFFSVLITADVRYLLSKFKEDQSIIGTNRLIPVGNNSDYNKQLKIIQAYAGIKKNLTTHVARHTFACLFLEAGGSMEVLQKMLGHARMSQTEHYGKIKPKRVSKEVRDALEYISNRDTKIIPISASLTNI